MRKVQLVCSLLLACGASMFGLGCDAGKPPAAKPADTPSATAPAGPDDAGKKATAPKPKPAGAGSTTGGGIEVPDAAGGTTEKPSEPSEPTEKTEKPEEK